MSTKPYPLPSPRNHPHKTFITRQSSVAIIRGREKSLLTSQYQILPHTPSTKAAAAAAANNGVPPQQTGSKFLYSAPSSHTMQQQYLQKRLPRPTLPVWTALGVHDKLPYPMQVFECEFSTRTKIGSSQMPRLIPIDFDLSDPYNVHNSDVLYYNPLYDPHLAHFYRRPNQLEKFRAIGQATEAGHVACTLKQYNEWRSQMYQRYLVYVRALRRQSRIWGTIYLLKNARKNIRALRQKAGEVEEPVEKPRKMKKKPVDYCDDADNLDNIAEHINYLDKPKDLNEFLPENYFVDNKTRVGGRRASIATRSKLRPFVEAEKLLARARVDVAHEYEMAVHTHHAKVEVDRFYDRLRWAKAHERRKKRMNKVVRGRHDAVDERIEKLWVKNEQARRSKAKQWLKNHIEFQKAFAAGQKAVARRLQNHYAGQVEAHERESRENYSQWRSSMNDIKARIKHENASSTSVANKSNKSTTRNKREKVAVNAPSSASEAEASAADEDESATDGNLSAGEQSNEQSSETQERVQARLTPAKKSRANKQVTKNYTVTLTGKKIPKPEKSMASLSCLSEAPKPVVKKRPAKRQSVRPTNPRDLENSEFISIPTPTSSAIAMLGNEEEQRKNERQQARNRAAKEPPKLKTKGGVSLATITKGRGKMIHQTNILQRQSGSEGQQPQQPGHQHHHVPLQTFKKIDLNVLPTLDMPPATPGGKGGTKNKQRKKSTAGSNAESADGVAVGTLELPKSNADMTSRLSSMPGSAESITGGGQSADNLRKLRIPTLSVTAIGSTSGQFGNEEMLKTMTPEEAELYRQQQAAASSSMLLGDPKSVTSPTEPNKQRKKSRKSFVLPAQPGSAVEDSSLQLDSSEQHRSARVPTLSVTAFNDAGQYEKQYNKLLAEVASTSSTTAEGEEGTLAATSSMELSREQIRTRQRSKKSFVMLDEQSRTRNLLGDDAANDDATSQSALVSPSDASVASLLERSRNKKRAPTLNLIQFNAESDANNTAYEREYNEMLASTTTIRELSDTSLARVLKAQVDTDQAKSNKSSLFGFSHQQSTALIKQAKFEGDMTGKRSRAVRDDESQQTLAGTENDVAGGKKRTKKKSFVLPKTPAALAAEAEQRTAAGNVEDEAERLTVEVLSNVTANIEANQTNYPYTTSPLTASARKIESDPTVSSRPKSGSKVRRFSLPVPLVPSTNVTVRRRDEDIDSMPNEDDRPPPTLAPLEMSDSAAFLAASSSAQRKSRTKSEVGAAFQRFSIQNAADGQMLSPLDRNKSIAGPSAKRGTVVGSLKLTFDSSAVEKNSAPDDSLTVQHAAVGEDVVRKRGSEYEYNGDEQVDEAAQERPQSVVANQTDVIKQQQKPPTTSEHVKTLTNSDDEAIKQQKRSEIPVSPAEATADTSGAPHKSRGKRRSKAADDVGRQKEAPSTDDNQTDVVAYRARRDSRAAHRNRASGEIDKTEDEKQLTSTSTAVGTVSQLPGKLDAAGSTTPIIQTTAPQVVDGETNAPHHDSAMKRIRRRSEPSASAGQQTSAVPSETITKTSKLQTATIEPKISQDATITLAQAPSTSSARNSDSDVYFVRRTVLNVPNVTSQTSTTSDKIILPTRTSNNAEASSNASLQTSSAKQKAEPIGTQSGTTMKSALLTASATPEQIAAQKQQRKVSVGAANTTTSGAPLPQPRRESAAGANVPKDMAKLAWGAPTEPPSMNTAVGSNISVTKAEEDKFKQRPPRPAVDRKTAGRPPASPSAPVTDPPRPPTTSSDTPLEKSSVEEEEPSSSQQQQQKAERGGFWPLKMLKKKRQNSGSSLGESRRSSGSGNSLVPSEQNGGAALDVITPDETRRVGSPSSTTIREHEAEFSYTDALGIKGNDDLMEVVSQTIVETDGKNEASSTPTGAAASRQQKRPQAPLGQYRPEGAPGSNNADSNVDIGRSKVADAENDDDEEGIDINLPYKPNLE